MTLDEHPLASFLIVNGWEVSKEKAWTLRKGSYELCFDTGSWLMLMTEDGKRIFDVPVLEPSYHQWLSNLIEELCKCRL